VSEPPDHAFTEIESSVPAVDAQPDHLPGCLDESSQSNGGLPSTQAAAKTYYIRKRTEFKRRNSGTQGFGHPLWRHHVNRALTQASRYTRTMPPSIMMVWPVM
jgi:hypothetical protein